MLTTPTTWAITNAEFLAGYGMLCVVAAAVISWQWRQAIGRTERGSDPLPELDVYEVALIGGGPQLALTTALTRLHRDKLLRIRQREGTLKVSGALDATAAPVEREVFEAVRREPGISTLALRKEVKSGDALASMSARLTQSGLLLDAEQAARVRRLWIVGALLTALGIARIVAASSHDPAVGWTAAMVLLVAGATVWLYRQRPLATSRGRDVLRRLRAERDDLRRQPLSGESALTVALFGAGALWLADPAAAAAIGVLREEEATGGPWGSGRGTGGGGASGCASGGGSDSGGGGCGGGGGGG